jgi:aspartate aminotransferase
MSFVRPSQTKAMTQRAADLRAQGRSVITLSQGQPDFDTPQTICEAGIEAITQGHTRYTPVAGTEILRDAIIEKFVRDNDLVYERDQITVGCGAKQVVFNALLATLDAGDEVIIPTPCWVSYPDMVHLAGGVSVPVASGLDTGFKLSPLSLEAAITPKTKWLILNSPSNPTGALYSRDELVGIANVLRRYPGVMVLSDDIYEKLVYGDAEFATMAQVAPDMKERSLTVNGVSKTYAMTGWRVGYGAGPTDLVSAMNTVQGQTTSHTSSISQYAAVTAIGGDQSYLSSFVDAFEKRRDLVTRMLNTAPGLSCGVPDGAFYVFPSCSGVIGRTTASGRVIETDTDFALFLLEEAGVAVVPGSGFLASPFIRISYATSMEQLEAACSNIILACQGLQ